MYVSHILQKISYYKWNVLRVFKTTSSCEWNLQVHNPRIQTQLSIVPFSIYCCCCYSLFAGVCLLTVSLVPLSSLGHVGQQARHPLSHIVQSIKVMSAVLLFRPSLPQPLLPRLHPNHCQLTFPCQMYNKTALCALRAHIFDKMYFWCELLTSEYFFLICNPPLIMMFCARVNVFSVFTDRLFCEKVKNEIENSIEFFFSIAFELTCRALKNSSTLLYSAQCWHKVKLNLILW